MSIIYIDGNKIYLGPGGHVEVFAVNGVIPDVIADGDWTATWSNGVLTVNVTNPPETGTFYLRVQSVNVYTFPLAADDDATLFPLEVAITPDTEPQIWQDCVASWTLNVQAWYSNGPGLDGPPSVAKAVTINQSGIWFIPDADHTIVADTSSGVVGVVDREIESAVTGFPGWELRTFTGVLPPGADSTTMLPLTWATTANTMLRTAPAAWEVNTGLPAGTECYGIAVWRHIATETFRRAANADHITIPTITPSDPPINLSVPILSAAPVIGTSLSATNGTWTGADTFAYQWQIDGVDIPGATTSSYTPVAGNDLKNLRIRVIGSGAGGATPAFSATQVVRYTAPAATGGAITEEFDLNSGPQTFAFSTYFTGSNLSYVISAPGISASINASTGVATFETTTAYAATVVTVTASNSGGSAQKTATVSVVEGAISWPSDLLSTDWDGEGITTPEVCADLGVTEVAGHTRVWVVDTYTVPAGFELWAHVGTVTGGGGTPSSMRRIAFVDGTLGDQWEWATGFTRAEGTRIYVNLRWLHVATDTYEFIAEKTFLMPPFVPVATDDIADVIATQGTTVSIDAKPAFSGTITTWEVTGASASISTNGIISIPTTTVHAAQTCTVSATNAGGTASVSFSVTVNAPPPSDADFPLLSAAYANAVATTVPLTTYGGSTAQPSASNQLMGCVAVINALQALAQHQRGTTTSAAMTTAKNQIAAWINNSTCPHASGGTGQGAVSGYWFQHDVPVTQACTIFAKTPPVWNAISLQNKYKLYSVCEGLAVAAGFQVSNDNLPLSTRKTIINRTAYYNNAPNQTEGMYHIVFGAMCFFGATLTRLNFTAMTSAFTVGETITAPKAGGGDVTGIVRRVDAANGHMIVYALNGTAAAGTATGSAGGSCTVSGAQVALSPAVAADEVFDNWTHAEFMSRVGTANQNLTRLAATFNRTDYPNPTVAQIQASLRNYRVHTLTGPDNIPFTAFTTDLLTYFRERSCKTIRKGAGPNGNGILNANNSYRGMMRNCLTISNDDIPGFGENGMWFELDGGDGGGVTNSNSPRGAGIQVGTNRSSVLYAKAAPMMCLGTFACMLVSGLYDPATNASFRNDLNRGIQHIDFVMGAGGGYLSFANGGANGRSGQDPSGSGEMHSGNGQSNVNVGRTADANNFRRVMRIPGQPDPATSIGFDDWETNNRGDTLIAWWNEVLYPASAP